MRNPNVWILLAALLLIAAVGAAGVLLYGGVNEPQNRPFPDTPIPAQNGPTEGAEAYLRVQVDDEVWDLIALRDGGEFTITQSGGEENVVHTTATGAVMHFSTCHNQSCIQQGEVTLDNRDSRVLGNMIICLPNEVILEVLTPEEAGMEAAQ